MSDPERQLRSRVAEALRREAHAITADWVEVISERLDVDQRDVLPTEFLLDHIPDCLEAIANYIEREEGAFPTDLLRDKMDALVRLRRSQGLGVTELLTEYEILASLLQAFIERAVRDLDLPIDPPAFAAVVGDLKESFAQFGLETARSYRIWVARERRERALQTTTFAAMLRHELRNRLGSAQTAAELLDEDGVDPERRARLVRLILRSLGQALEAVDVVKGIVADEPADPEAPAWLPLVELLQNVAGGTAAGTGQPRIELDIRDDPEIRVPGPRVSMVLLNLIDNAIKYHDEGKEERWVRIETELLHEDGDDAEWVRITVSDNGRGIEPSLQPSIFDFSVRGPDKEAGSGLGLALSRDIVDQLGGSIQLDSEPGAGTRVSFVVPARRPGSADD